MNLCSVAFNAVVRKSIERREYLHARPQMAYEETEAHKLVADVLRALGLSYRVIAKTGIVVDICGDIPDPDNRMIAFRADMDALPIFEKTDLPYVSQYDGFMHACGHDGHTVMLLGALELLARNRNFKGTVRAIFQPAEELGALGAKTMVEEGCFDGMDIERHPVFAFHNWPTLPLGTMATSPGAIMAAADYYNIAVLGRGGHVGLPEHFVNPISVAADLERDMRDLQNSMNARGRVVSFETTQMCSTPGPLSAVPGRVDLGGSVRSFAHDTRQKLQDAVTGFCDQARAQDGIEVELDYKVGTDPTINDPVAADFACAAAVEVFGQDRVNAKAEAAYTAEDFGRMLQALKGAYLWLGQGTQDPDSPHNQILHSDRYDFNNDLIPYGIRLYLELVKRALPVAGPSLYLPFSSAGLQ